MRQRHRQWLAAMALTLSLPVSTESFSGSATPLSQQIITLEQRGTNPVTMNVPNMFLSSRSTVSQFSDNRFGGRAIVDQDRTLGFDISALNSHSVDSSKWNAGNVLDENSPLKSTWKRSSLAWFPWIPSRTQIMSLKQLELKQACAERGLKKVRSLSSVNMVRYLVLHSHVLIAFHYSVGAQGGTAGSFVGLDFTAAAATRGKAPGYSNGHGTRSIASLFPKEKTTYTQIAVTQGQHPGQVVARWFNHLLTRREAIHREKLQGKNESIYSH